jgi:hypothetical protein
MRRLRLYAIIASALATLVAPASAQMNSHGAMHQSGHQAMMSQCGAMTSQSVGRQNIGGPQAMTSQCNAMMQEVMADPIVRKRMIAIMQTYLQKHPGSGYMMTPGMSNGNNMMQGGGNMMQGGGHMMQGGSQSTPSP